LTAVALARGRFGHDPNVNAFTLLTYLTTVRTVPDHVPDIG